MAIDNIARGMAASSSGGGGGGINADIVKGVGIDFEGTDPITIKNTGVTSVSESSTNGTINVSNGGKTPVQVPVHGLGTAAYKNVDAFLASDIKYAGSDVKGGVANSAKKLTNTEAIGSETKAVYFDKNGIPVACTYEVNKDVPADAELTDTTYVVSTGTANGEIAITPSNADSYTVKVKGLNNAAYKDVADAIAESDENLVTSGLVYAGLDKKLDKNSVIDSVSNGNKNPVTSGAVYSALTNKADKDVFNSTKDGLVPQSTDVNAFLKGDGTWAATENTTYTISEGSTNGTIKVVSSDEPNKEISVPVHGLGTAAYKNVDTIVPSTRKVNEKVLSSDIVLNGADIKTTGYSKAKSKSDIVGTDTINQAVGKLEYKVDTNETNISTVVNYINNGDFEENSDVAMVKTVPDKVAGYAGIKKIGGRTVKTKNLFNNTAIGDTIYGVTFTINNDKSITLSGTSTQTAFLMLGSIYLNAGKSYIFSGGANEELYLKVQTSDSSISFNVKNVDYKYTPTEDVKLYIYSRVPANYTITDNAVIYPMVRLKDNTDATYEPYFEGLRNAAVESVVSTSADGTTETTLLIPDALKSLPDWGCAVSDEIYNWYDAENKVYHHRVGSVDLGSFTWDLNGTYAGGFGCNHNLSIGSHAMICDRYTVLGRNFAWVSFETNPDKIIGTDSSYSSFMIKDLSLSSYDKETFNNEIQGVMLNYELATEELIDISDILHPIRCEAGGTITFNNEHSLDVPNTIVYKKEVSLNE